MRRFVSLIGLFLVCPAVLGKPEAPDPVKVIQRFASSLGNEQEIRALVAEDAEIVRVTPDGHTSQVPVSQFINWRSQKSPLPVEERVSNIVTENRGDVIVARATYEVLVRGRVRGCGVNELELTRIDERLVLSKIVEIQTARQACKSRGSGVEL